MLQQYRKIHGL
jgi:hypothetical protein